jgi:hypothetical protein
MGYLPARPLGTWPVINLGPTGVSSFTPTSYVLMRGWNALCTLGLLSDPVNDSHSGSSWTGLSGKQPGNHRCLIRAFQSEARSLAHSDSIPGMRQESRR